MICLKCKKIVDSRQALVHPQSKTLLFCNTCKRLLIDFGREFVRLSPADTIQDFDKDPSKYVSYEKIFSFIQDPDVDIKILQCQDAIQVKPDNTDARVTLIKLYLTKKDFDNALKEIIELEAITGETVILYSLLADTFAGAGNFQEAIKFCAKILKIEEGNHYARYNLGIALACLGNYHAAANQFTKILKSNPRHREAKNALEQVKSLIDPE